MIKGIDLLSSNTTIQQLADDSTLFVEDEASLLMALDIFEDFKGYSGLELNLAKTKGLNIGDVQLSSPKAIQIEWEDSMELLGITVERDTSLEKENEQNFEPSITKMENICAKWAGRNISLKGKVVLLNTLILPVIYYQASMLYVSQKFHAQVDRIISKFLWSGKRPKISRSCLELLTTQGGLGLHCFRDRVATSKVAWV